MPRDANGNYTLPAGNPVITGTTIDTTWANPTMQDIGNELTNSLSRTGEGGMLVPFQFVDGAVATPGITWTNETTTGFYRAGASDMRVSVGAVDKFRWTATSVQVWNSVDLIWEDVAANTGGFLPLSGGTLSGTGEILTLQDSVNNGVDTYTFMSFRSADQTEMGSVGVSNLAADAMRVIAYVSSLELTSTTNNVNLNANSGAINLSAANVVSTAPVSIQNSLNTNTPLASKSGIDIFKDSGFSAFIGVVENEQTTLRLNADSGDINLTTPTSIELNAPDTNINGNTRISAPDVGVPLSIDTATGAGDGRIFISKGGVLLGTMGFLANSDTLRIASEQGEIDLIGTTVKINGVPIGGINGSISTVDGSILSGTGFTVSFASTGVVNVIFDDLQPNTTYKVLLGGNIVNYTWADKAQGGFEILTFTGAGSPAGAIVDFNVIG